MSALPKAVQRQIDEANKLAAQVKLGGQPPASDPAATPPGQPSAAPAAPAAAAQPTPPVPGQPGIASPEDSWEKKFRVLQGKYNAEVPRLSQQIRELTSQNQNLQSQLTTTQALLTSLGRQQASAPAGTPVPAPAAAGKKLVKDEEVKNFGADLYDFIQRAAREVMPAAAPAASSPQVAQEVQQVRQQVEQLSTEAAQTKQQKMVTMLNEQVPSWEQVNADPEFLAWLNQTDPYSGTQRLELFDQAAGRFDGPRVVAFFKGFQNEHAAVTPPPSQTPAPAAAAAPPAGTPATLERLVAPGTAKAGAAGAPNEAQKRVYTRAEFEDFVRRKNQFVVKGRKVPDTMVAEERELLKAANEGRISG
jgi:hypothetical protein